MNPLIERLEAMLAKGSDNLLLRFGLGKAYAEEQLHDQAIAHLGQAVAFDPMHSGSWFWLGRAQYEGGRLDDALVTLERAVEVADRKGDVQAGKMARVFLSRVKKAQQS